jgi:hypothetical protein
MPPYVHKRFRRLAAYISDEACATFPFRQLLAAPLTAYYSTFLRGSSFDGIHSINFYLTSLPTEDGRMEKIIRGYLDYYLLVDFHLLARLATDQQRQQYLLTRIQQGVRQVAQQEGWEIGRFERA